MYICRNCKKQLNDENVFCQYCGTPVVKNPDQLTAPEAKEKTLESYSLALKEASEAMIKEYVTNLKSMEILIENTKNANLEKDEEIGRLKERLSTSEKIASDYFSQLQNAQTELAQAKDQVRSLTDKLSKLQDSPMLNTSSIPVLSEEEKSKTAQLVRPDKCPVCGKLLNKGTVFCPGCGKRVNYI